MRYRDDYLDMYQVQLQERREPSLQQALETVSYYETDHFGLTDDGFDALDIADSYYDGELESPVATRLM